MEPKYFVFHLFISITCSREYNKTGGDKRRTFLITAGSGVGGRQSYIK